MKEKPTAKRAKSTVRIADPKAVSDAHAKLEAMTLTERIAAVAADVASKRDEYRSIDRHELASLLGVGDARCPGGEWDFVWFIPHMSIEDICESDDMECVLELLQPHVTAQRYEELNSRFALIDRSKLGRGRLMSDLLTNVEKRTIERLHMENQDEAYDTQVLAFYTINAPHRKKLTFEAFIGDNGESDDLKTPYDERDGAFSDLSESLIVEDRRR